MIRRDLEDGWLLVSQRAHAALAGELAAAWGNDRFEPVALAESVLSAITRHDDGWDTWEAAPDLSGEGAPRNFTEMPMATATAIWTGSIESAAAAGPPAHREALQQLEQSPAAGDRAMTYDHAKALETLLRREVLVETGEFPAEILADLRAIGLVSDCTSLLLPHRVDYAGERLGTSPLGGLWVSRHFARLAESALESRSDGDDIAATREFLAAQVAYQQSLRPAAAEMLKTDDVTPFEELGFRYVRQFDYLSLWLCGRFSPDDLRLTFPGAGELQFRRITDETIRVDPFPFAEPLSVSTTATKVAAPLADADALRQQLMDSESIPIRWDLLP